MPELDSCINDVYEAGHVASSSGLTPTRVVLGSLLDPDNYDPASVTHSLDFTKFYNSGYAPLLIGW
jgi:hypothetical protein